MTALSKGRRPEGETFQRQLKCVLFHKIWLMAEVNPSFYPNNYSVSGFTDVHRAHIYTDPLCDDATRAHSRDNGYLIQTNHWTVTAGLRGQVK